MDQPEVVDGETSQAEEQQPQFDLEGDEPKKTRGRGSRKTAAREPRAAKAPRAAKKSSGTSKAKSARTPRARKTTPSE